MPFETRLSEELAPAFYKVHRNIRQGDCREVILTGGRGSGKSSYVSMELILQLLQNKNIHAVVLRKRENRLRSSVYTQLQWAIRKLGLEGLFRNTYSPMEMQYLPTGQKIYFFGMDDPDKIKSIKAPFGHLGILWFEEFDQYSGPEEIRNVEQSVLRGGDYSLCFKTFNPPQSAAHWANREAAMEKPGRCRCRSSYLEVSPDWLGERFLEEASYLKEKDIHAYEHEYLGIANGVGGAVFRNVRVRAISKEERQELSDRLYRGIDWGWYP